MKLCLHQLHNNLSSSTPQQSSIQISPSSSGILDAKKIKAVRSASCSRRNFSTKLVDELFDEDTRKRSNVAGKLGKLKLNPVLIDYESLTLQFYHVQYSESEKTEWAKCVIAINEIVIAVLYQTKLYHIMYCRISVFITMDMYVPAQLTKMNFTLIIKKRTPSLALTWSHGSIITLSLLLSKVKRNKYSHRRQVIASQQPASTSNGSMQQWRSLLSCIRVRSSVTAII